MNNIGNAFNETRLLVEHTKLRLTDHVNEHGVPMNAGMTSAFLLQAVGMCRGETKISAPRRTHACLCP